MARLKKHWLGSDPGSCWQCWDIIMRNSKHVLPSLCKKWLRTCMQHGQICNVSSYAGGWFGAHCHCGSSRGHHSVSICLGDSPGSTCFRGSLNSPGTAAATPDAPPNCPHHHSFCPFLCFSPVHAVCDRCVPTGEAPPSTSSTPRVRCSAPGAHATYHVPAHVASSASCRCLCTLPLCQQPMQAVCVL